MKKTLALLLVAVMALGLFAGCGGDKGAYKDGPYTAEYKEYDKRGWKEKVTVTVKDGKVATVDFDAFNKDDNHRKSEDQSYIDTMKPISGIAPDTFYKEIEDQYVQVQKAADVKAVTGATNSTKNFQDLMTELEKSMAEGKTDAVIVDLATHDDH